MPQQAFITPTLPHPRRRLHASQPPRCSLHDGQASTRLKSLRAQLSAAVTAQNFVLAAQLRDQITTLENTASDELAVALANEAFYNALRNSDIAAMETLWLPSDSVSCAFATTGFANGFEDVIASWRRVFTAGRATAVEVQEVNASIQRNIAWVICKQVISSMRGRESFGGERFATNIFQKRRGKWFMVHHHASPIVPPEESRPPPPPPPTTA